MKVLVTGGTGFLGREVVRQLVQAGHQVHVLTRKASSFKVAGAEPVMGDITHVSAWEERLRDFEACVHLVGILRENRSAGVTFEKMHYQATLDLLRSCGKMGVTRFLHVSANGVEKGLSTPYMRSKALAEQAVRSSKLNWTIFRPSLIYGGETGQSNFVDMIRGHLRPLSHFPYFGDGSYRMAPISAQEVAASIVKSLADEQTVGKSYHLCGTETYTYKALLLLINQAGNYRCKLFSVPMWLINHASSVLGGFAWFPVTADMVKMLAAGNDCPGGVLTQRDLGVSEASFKDWLTTGVLPEYPKVTSLPGPTAAPIAEKEEAPAPVAAASVTTELKGAPLTTELKDSPQTRLLDSGSPTTRPLSPDEPP